MLYVFLTVTAVFAAALSARKVGARLCAICAGVAVTWLGLLWLYRSGRYHDGILLGLLIGQSIAGIFYFAQRRLPVALRVFALPFLLTLTAIFYWAITGRYVMSALAFLALLWIAAWLIFVSRNDPGKKSLAGAAMDCCGEDE